MTRLPNDMKPGWLMELQQKSWEPEILLSGIVLYGLFKTPALLDQFLDFAKINIHDQYTDLDNLIALFKIALYWLTLGLILHLISRGIWVGMIGLSYTFPDGINRSKLKLSGKFENKIDKIPAIDQIIMNLEKLCSSLFSISFMMFMMIIGGYFFVLISLVIPVISFEMITGPRNVNPVLERIIDIYAKSVLIIGAIGLLDFVTLGFFKRFKWISKVYYPLYKIISFLTFARFYRPIYYTLISNYNKWKIGISLVFFVVSSVFLLGNVSSSDPIPNEAWTRITLWNNQGGTTAFSGYYDDQNKDFHSVRAQIQSDIITGNTIRLFVVSRIGLEDSIKKNCNYDSLIKLDTGRNYVELHCVSQFYTITLNGKPINDLHWNFHYKQQTNQRGIITYIDATDLPRGTYSLEVWGPKAMYRRGPFANIPFYREISNKGYSVVPKKETEPEEEFIGIKPLLTK